MVPGLMALVNSVLGIVLIFLITSGVVKLHLNAGQVKSFLSILIQFFIAVAQNSSA